MCGFAGPSVASQLTSNVVTNLQAQIDSLSSRVTEAASTATEAKTKATTLETKLTNSADTGSIFSVAYGYSKTITGALPCTGGLYSPTAYPNLFNTIGYNYGGSGTATTISFSYPTTGLVTQSVTVDYVTHDIYTIATTSSDKTGTKYLSRFTSTLQHLSTNPITVFESAYKYVSFAASNGAVMISETFNSAHVAYTFDAGATWRLMSSTSYTYASITAAKSGVYAFGYNSSDMFRYYWADPDAKGVYTITTNSTVSSGGGYRGCPSNGDHAFVTYPANGYFLEMNGRDYTLKSYSEYNVSNVYSFPYINGKYWMLVKNTSNSTLAYVRSFDSFGTISSLIPLRALDSRIANYYSFTYESWHCMIINDGFVVPVYAKHTSSSSSEVSYLMVYVNIKDYSYTLIDISPAAVSGVDNGNSYVSELISNYYYWYYYRIAKSSINFRVPSASDSLYKEYIKT